MATITHAFESEKSDGGDATLVRPSDWNADHVIEGDVPYGFIGAKAYRTTVQTLAAGTPTVVGFASEEFDTDGFHDNSTNPSRFTVPAGLGGKYRVTGYSFTAVNTTHLARILKNGTAVRGQSIAGGAASGTAFVVTVGAIDLAAGDYVELSSYLGAGGDIGDATNAEQQPYLMVEKLDAGRVGSGVGARAYNVGFQTISNNTDTIVTFGAEEFDTDNFHSTSSNTSRLTVPAGLGGKYHVVGGGLFQPNETGRRYMQIMHNGSAARGSQYEYTPGGSAYAGGHATAVLNLAAGDYVELRVFQTSGGNLDFGWDGAVPAAQAHLSIMRLDSAGANVTDAVIADLGSDTAFNTSYVDGPSVTPPAGTYDIFWKAIVVAGGGSVRTYYAKLLAGSTQIDYTETMIQNQSGYRHGFGGFALGIVLDGSTAVKFQVRSDVSTNTLSRNGGDGNANDASKIEMRRVK